MTHASIIRQIAYFVPDIRAAALAHNRLHGSGPYFVAEHIPLKESLHRGVQRPLDHSSAYGQWGPLMIEFVQQNNAGPSAFHDVYPEAGQAQGIHHIALMVNDLAAEISRYNAAGHDTALYGVMNDGFTFAMIDTVSTHGHMLELYPPVPSLVGFYNFVAKSAQTFDGANLLRDIRFD